MIILVMIFQSILNFMFFFLGLKIGRLINKNTEILNPIVEIKERIKEKRVETKAKEESDREAEKYSTILENIENYDGTARNQKDVPM